MMVFDLVDHQNNSSKIDTNENTHFRFVLNELVSGMFPAKCPSACRGFETILAGLAYGKS